jgi:hypothetical protein
MLDNLFIIYDFDRDDFYCESCELWVGARNSLDTHIVKHKKGEVGEKAGKRVLNPKRRKTN